jgi:hypothetical protein
VAKRKGRRDRPLHIEAIQVELTEGSGEVSELGEEWVKFLAKTVNRLVEMGELVNIDGRIEVNPERGDK